MKQRLAVLACRRRELLERIEAQRREVADISRQWQRPLALADTGLKAVRFIRHHPVLWAGAMSALMALRRKGVVSLVRDGWHRLRRIIPIFPSV